MKSITVSELQQLLESNEDIQLIDVRESWEHQAFHIGGILVPLGTLIENMEKVSKNKVVVFYCQKGIRSQIAIQRLQLKSGFENLFNLSGGMDAWKAAGLPSAG